MCGAPTPNPCARVANVPHHRRWWARLPAGHGARRAARVGSVVWGDGTGKLERD